MPSGWGGGSSPGQCPYTEWKITKDAPTDLGWSKQEADNWGDGYNLYYKTVMSGDQPEALNIQVEWYGNSCKNPSNHPVSPT